MYWTHADGLRRLPGVIGLAPAISLFFVVIRRSGLQEGHSACFSGGSPNPPEVLLRILEDPPVGYRTRVTDERAGHPALARRGA